MTSKIVVYGSLVSGVTVPGSTGSLVPLPVLEEWKGPESVCV